jgi:hypothetical protein
MAHGYANLLLERHQLPDEADVGGDGRTPRSAQRQRISQAHA